LLVKGTQTTVAIWLKLRPSPLHDQHWTPEARA
jgi:hypothetical protein